MYETVRIVGKLRPKYILWENVRNVLNGKHKHNFDNYINTLSVLGYNSYYKVLNAVDYGIPQNRERVYTVSIRKDIDKGNFVFPEKQELKLRLNDFLEKKVDKKFYLSPKMIGYISKTGTQNYKNKDCRINLDIARPLTVVHDKRAGTTNYISNELPNNYNLTQNETTAVIRRLTPKECWRLMGFTDTDFYKAAEIPTSNMQLYKQAGNSIVVNVLAEIFKNLFKEVTDEREDEILR